MAEIITTFDAFREVCAAQQVGLDEHIVTAAQNGLTTDTPDAHNGLIYAITPELVAVAESGRILREKPGSLLSLRPVNLSQLDIQSIGVRSLAHMINDSHFPFVPDALAETGTSFTSEPTEAIDVCQPAEQHFAGTIDSIIQRSPANQHGFQILESYGRPILIRKTLGRASSLSLVDLTVNGIRYPVGSLYRVELATDRSNDYYRTYEGLEMPELPNEVREIVSAKLISRIAFIRLSGFAVDNTAENPAARDEFHMGMYQWSPAERAIGVLPLSDIRSAIRSAPPSINIVEHNRK